MGWDLRVGEIQETYVTDEEIWRALNNFYARSQVTMSYKYGFLKALMENLYNVNQDLVLNYDKIFYSFTKIYWNLVIHHSLGQSNNRKQPSAIQKVLGNFCQEYAIPKEWTFDKLEASLQLEIIKSIKNKGKRYVIGAFYADTQNFFYEFDLKKEHLKFSAPVYKFLQKYQKIITYLTNYHLAKFLEKHNDVPNINYILGKVEVISKRSSLNEFYQILMKYDENVCFYCGTNLSNKRRKTHIDHFIPWSFIQSDNIWNLVMSCQDCNLSKNDKLAADHYLLVLIDRNEEFLEKSDLFQREDLQVYSEKKLTDLYQYSMDNGFNDIWVPKRNIL